MKILNCGSNWKVKKKRGQNARIFPQSPRRIQTFRNGEFLQSPNSGSLDSQAYLFWFVLPWEMSNVISMGGCLLLLVFRYLFKDTIYNIYNGYHSRAY